jgi:hypothetical protein
MHPCMHAMLATQEELEKQRQRAARFNTEKPVAVEYKPDADEVAKVKRAIKYEKKYEPSEAVLMDMGKRSPHRLTPWLAQAMQRLQYDRPQRCAPTLSLTPPILQPKRPRCLQWNSELFPCSPFHFFSDLFEARTEAARDVERRPDTIHLYGVDVMSTADVLQYFGAYGPTFVEWINDSSCECGVEWSGVRVWGGVCGDPPEPPLILLACDAAPRSALR